MFSLIKHIKNRVIFTYLLSLLLSGVAFGVFLWLNPYPIYPYRLVLLTESPASSLGTAFFDLSGNGVGEKVKLMSYNNFPVVEIYTQPNEYITTYRLPGEWPTGASNFLLRDLNNNGLGEIYTVTLVNDSIVLNGFEPFGENEHFLVNLFLDVTQKVNDKYDVGAAFFTSNDTDGDGYEEIFLIISAGYSLFPRKVYRYDLQSGKLNKTMPMAARINRAFFFDINGSGRKEIFVNANATENFKDREGVLYSDTSAWIFGYNHLLDSLFLVWDYSDEKSYSDVMVKETAEGHRVFVSLYKQKSNYTELRKYTLDGELIKKQIPEPGNHYGMLNAQSPRLDLIALNSYNGMLLYDDELNLLNKGKITSETLYANYLLADSITPLFVFGKKNDELVMFDEEFFILGKIRIEDLAQSSSLTTSWIKTPENGNLTVGVFNQSNKIFHIQGMKNQLYPFRYVLSASVFLLLFLIFHSLLLIQNYFIKKRLNTEMQLVSLQMQSIQNQLQPHFTFNILNNIAALIHKGETARGYRYLNDFADMLRIILSQPDSTYWLLEDEINFIETYLGMENLRYENKFQYSINVDNKSLYSRHLPKLMLQTFVENSIKHGLVHKEGPGNLEISITSDNDHMHITLTDNGIGREASALLLRKSTGKGIMLIREYMSSYNKIHDKKFELQIIDVLGPSREPAGTKVIIVIPDNY